MRGRNVEWAEKAVRQAASLPAEEALKNDVIDLLAADVPALLQKLDGREVTVADRPVKLATAGATLVRIEADWRTKLLAVITNPNVASLLMLIGVYALIFEFYSPGMIGPGVVGAICILLALYAFQVLPVDYTGLALLLLGIGMMVAEAFIGAFGALGIGGLDRLRHRLDHADGGGGPGFTVAWELVGSIALALGLTFILLTTSSCAPPAGRRRSRADDRQHRPGARMAGRRGPGAGARRMWNARSTAPLSPGQQVRVTRIDGLTLHVEPDEQRRE